MLELLLMIAALVIVWAIIDRILQRSRRKAEANLTPEQIRGKRALERVTDNIG